MKTTLSRLFPLLSLLTLPAAATMPFEKPLWIGKGTVFEVDPKTNNKDNIQLYVENFKTGTLVLDHLALDAMLPKDRVRESLKARYKFRITGGNADLMLANTSSSDRGRGKEYFNSVNLTGLEGVTKIDVTLSFNEPVAARKQALHILECLPLVGANGCWRAGEGLNEKDFNVTVTYRGTASSKDGLSFTRGIPQDGEPVVTKGFDARPIIAPTFLSNGYTGLVVPGGGPVSKHFLTVRGYDCDGQSGFTKADCELHYAKSIQWVITPGKGTFKDDTGFIFSMDGQQHANFLAVPATPEPATAVLGMLGALALLRRRR